jgi:hypothetical protein
MTKNARTWSKHVSKNYIKVLVMIKTKFYTYFGIYHEQ